MPEEQKPDAMIRVIDFETTGLEASDAVIESAFYDLWRDAGTLIPGEARLHFAEAISPEARAASHIWPEDIREADRFDPEEFVQAAVAAGASGLAAHNAGFEAQWIKRHTEGAIHLICTFKAALRIWPEAPSHANFALAYWLSDQGLIEIDRPLAMPAHRALPDCYITGLILRALFRAGATGPQMVKWTQQPALYPRCPIGEHRGKPWAEVPGGFLRWMRDKTDMDPDYRFCAGTEIERRGEK